MLATRVLNTFRKVCSITKGLVSQVALPEPKLNRDPGIWMNISFGNGYYSYHLADTGPISFIARQGLLNCTSLAQFACSEVANDTKKQNLNG
jgi:hypothetical protein